jgi:hypothetical protein
MSHEVIIIHQGSGEGGEVESKVSYKPSHSLSEDEQFRRLKHANHVLDKLGDYLYAPPGAAAPDED